MGQRIDKIPNTAKLFHDGWGNEIAVALINAAEMYITAFASNGGVMGECHIRDIQNLLMLFRAVMKDVTTVDLENPDSF